MDSCITALKALSDETRYAIVSQLLRHDFCVSALARELGISEGAVSQQLQILRKAELVHGEKRGYYTHYAVDREKLREAARSLDELSHVQQEECACESLPPHERDCCCPHE